MDCGFNIFEREEALAGKAASYLAHAPEDDGAVVLAALLQGYQSLLHETKQLIRMADRRELELNRLNRKLQSLTRSLAFQAEHDALTGALNKAAVNVAVQRQVKNDCGFLLLLDIDHFKKVNDTWGHLVGDLILKQVADRIQGAIGANDVLGRFGGEEFVVCGDIVTPALALAAAEEVRGAIADESFDIGNSTPLSITISIGLTVLQPGDSAESAMARADLALYAAKRGGRNRVEQG